MVHQAYLSAITSPPQPGIPPFTVPSSQGVPLPQLRVALMAGSITHGLQENIAASHEIGLRANGIKVRPSMEVPENPWKGTLPHRSREQGC